MQQPHQDGWVDQDGRRWFKTVRDAVWACEQIGMSAKIVALRLVEYGADAFPSHATLARYTSQSERSVRNALRELERNRIIVTRRTGRSSRYSLFHGVRIPELGMRAVPDPSPDNGGAPPPTTPDRQILPITNARPRSADSADQTGSSCRSDRQALPTKRGVKRKEKRGAERARRARPAAPQLFFTFEGWECSDALRAELIQLGIPSERITYRLRRLKNSPINGGKGVRSLDDYVRDTATEFWVPWEAERTRKANCSGGTGVSSSFGGGGPTPGAGGAPGASKRPLWWTAECVKIAEKRGLNLVAEAKAFARTYGPGVRNTDASAVASAFALHLRNTKPSKGVKQACAA